MQTLKKGEIMILLWLGNKNCTFGASNKKTGKHSLHGFFVRFKSNEDREWFLSNAVFYGSFCAYKCNDKTGRRYELGSSVYSYNEHLEMLDYFVCDNENIPIINQ